MYTNGVNLHTMQYIQQVYQSNMMTSAVEGRHRMREINREVPRFEDAMERVTEPVVRKVTQPVVSTTDESALNGQLLYRALGAEYAVRPKRDDKRNIEAAINNYNSSAKMASGPVDYVDHSHGSALDIYF